MSFFSLIIFSCSSNNKTTNISIKSTCKKSKDWHLKDIFTDTIPGISLERAYNTILKDKRNSSTVIVALLDTKIDINHIELKNSIWINPLEKVNNSIDDDNNGYVDDINGWNFIGNNQGESVIIENYEFTRIVRQLESKFKGNSLDTSDVDYKKYKLAKLKHDKKLISAKKSAKRSKEMMAFYIESREALKGYFPDYVYTTEVLNSIDTVGNDLSKYVEEIRLMIKYKDTDENFLINCKNSIDSYEKKVNIDYYPRKLVKDNPYNINDTIYGNNLVSDYTDIINHGTRVSGILARTCNSCNDKQNIKILPVVIVPNGGSTHDKDIALGIRYAVNQGAKVINMSFGKNHSLNSKWIEDAMIYAEKNNVLLIAAAGNGGEDLDKSKYLYPNDSYFNEPEFCDNFLYVGASSAHINSSLVTYSDYGKKTVDIFAPGEDVYTTYPNNEYNYDSGTSLSSALTSKVAALIFSHYPNLTASQVKHIIMDSGVAYTFPVKTPTREDKDKMTPFNELSKSGKVVNAYNALILADSISRQKN